MLIVRALQSTAKTYDNIEADAEADDIHDYDYDNNSDSNDDVARRGERDRGRPRRVRDQRQGVAEGGRRPRSARVGLPVASGHRI